LAQFDVHRNPGRRTRNTIPFVVIVQSRIFDRAEPLRLVGPLYRANPLAGAHSNAWGSELAPRFDILGAVVVLYPLGLTQVPAAELGDAVASLADDESAGRIIAAIDRVISRAYG